MEGDGYIAVWMERSDGFAQIVAVMFNVNLAHVKALGWIFPRIVTTQGADGEIDLERLEDKD